MKLFAAVALGSIVVVAAITCFTGSSDTQVRGRTYATSWMISTLDSDGVVGMYPSLALDSRGNAHIGYRDGTNCDLKYATNAGGSWAISTIDSVDVVGTGISIALDSADRVHMSYWDDTNHALKYATNTGGSWMITTIQSGIYGGFTTLAIDSGDKVHICYNIAYVGLHYVTNAGGSWAFTFIGGIYGSGDAVSIALDSSDHVHVAYEGTSGISYATNAGGSWVVSDVASGVGASLALDSGDYAHIGYISSYVLKYATNVDGTWMLDTVAKKGEGRYASIGLDHSNKVHISYYDPQEAYLMYATNAGGSWATSGVDSVRLSMAGTSLAVSSDGWVHIAYYDSTNGDLKYATDASPVVGFKLDLVPGWNLVSVPPVGKGYMASTLGLVTGDIVCGWNPATQTYDTTYVVGVSLPFKDFAIEASTGYWIMTKEPETLTLQGSIPTGTQSRSITVPGPGSWAIVGFNTIRADIKASDIVANYTGASVTQVVSYTPSVGYKTYNPLLPFTDYYIVPGQAYWISCTASGTLAYQP